MPTKQTASPTAKPRRTVNIVLPPLHPAQIAICDHRSRFKVIAAGRRFGKGVLGVSEAFKRGIGGMKCRWVSPSYSSDSYQASWSIASNLAAQIPEVVPHLQKKMFDFGRLGGGWLQFRTAEEPDGLRGEGVDFVIFDEAAHVKNLKDMWEQCVRPSLMDRKGGAWFISTPRGFNFFAELYKRGDGESKEPDWAAFHYPTHSNPNIAWDEIAALRKDMPALVARQEIDAEFVQLAGALFNRDNILVLEQEPPGLSWVRSWDLAWTKKTTSDYTAGAKMAMDRNGMVILADLVHDRFEWPAAVRCISATAKADGAAVRQGIECVAAQEGMLQLLMADPLLCNLSFEPLRVHTDKITRALPLIARAEQRKFAIVRAPWNKKFLDEAAGFPEGDHDDMVDACTGAMQMIGEPSGAFSSASQIAVPTMASTGHADASPLDLSYRIGMNDF